MKEKFKTNIEEIVFLFPKTASVMTDKGFYLKNINTN